MPGGHRLARNLKSEWRNQEPDRAGSRNPRRCMPVPATPRRPPGVGRRAESRVFVRSRPTGALDLWNLAASTCSARGGSASAAPGPRASWPAPGAITARHARDLSRSAATSRPVGQSRAGPAKTRRHGPCPALDSSPALTLYLDVRPIDPLKLLCPCLPPVPGTETPRAPVVFHDRKDQRSACMAQE